MNKQKNVLPVGDAPGPGRHWKVNEEVVAEATCNLTGTPGTVIKRILEIKLLLLTFLPSSNKALPPLFLLSIYPIMQRCTEKLSLIC